MSNKKNIYKLINTKKATIGIIGLGYVGLPLSILFSKKGFKVIGFDIDNSKIKKLKKKPTLVLIDGNKIPKMKNYDLKTIIKGDQKISSISAASIIAKVARDKMITNLGKRFKGYYLDKNSGYGTKQHLKAIRNLGITSHHRKTFSPINKIK